MNNFRLLRWVIAVLIVALLVSLGFLARALWQNYWWKEEVYGLAGYSATLQALADFRAGKLRIYELDGAADKTTFSGRFEGPFEIWTHAVYPEPGEPHRYSREQYVSFYNRKMRYMQKHPERFRTNKEVDSSELMKDAPK